MGDSLANNSHSGRNAFARAADISKLPPALPPVHLYTLRLKSMPSFFFFFEVVAQWTSGCLHKHSFVVDFMGVPVEIVHKVVCSVILVQS